MFIQSRIKPREIEVGKAVAWAVYDDRGRLLLNKGTVVRSQRQLDALLEHGLYRARHKEDLQARKPLILQTETNPFDQLHVLTLLIRDLNFGLRDCIAGSGERIPGLALDIQRMCRNDFDATLGAVHLSKDFDYVDIHPLHVAILCQLIADFLNYDHQRCISLLSAALTANIGMLDLQAQLHYQREPLTPEQRLEVQQHPQKSVQILQSVGIDDELWLKAIDQHHECMDGSGYLGLKGDEIMEEARIIGLADRYAAMITGRYYRPGKTPNECLKNLFRVKGNEYDETLSLAFIKSLGIFPPGSFVRLENGDIAVVTKRPENGMWPLAMSIITPRGGAYRKPVQRDCSKSGEGIKELYVPDDLPPLDLPALWEYTA